MFSFAILKRFEAILDTSRMNEIDALRAPLTNLQTNRFEWKEVRITGKPVFEMIIFSNKTVLFIKSKSWWRCHQPSFPACYVLLLFCSLIFSVIVFWAQKQEMEQLLYAHNNMCILWMLNAEC